MAAEYIDGSLCTEAHLAEADAQTVQVNAHHDATKALVRKAKALLQTFFQHTFFRHTFFLSLSASLEMLPMCRCAVHAEKTAAASVLPHASVYVVRFMSRILPFPCVQAATPIGFGRLPVLPPFGECL